MKKLYIHVGPHKTGSTLIQKFFLDNRKNCIKTKIVYPEKYINHFGHHEFRNRIVKRQISKEDIQYFEDFNADVLLSSEDFISLGLNDFKYVKEKLNTFDINIIYCWRRTSYKLYSIWQEVIKHGGIDSYAEYYYDHLTKPILSAVLSPLPKLKMFINCFGENNLHIIDYDASLRADSLLKDFSTLIGIKSIDGFITISLNHGARNYSLTPEDVEVLRAINSTFKFKFNIDPSPVREYYLRHQELLNSHGLIELKDIVKKSLKKKHFGNYFIDNHSEINVVKSYKENIVNYEDLRDKKVLDIPSTEWLLYPKSQILLASVANKLKEYFN